MRYRVGDKVKVRDDLIVDTRYGKAFFVDRMKELSGKVVTIESVNEEDYKIKESNYCWTDEMFESDTVNIGEMKLKDVSKETLQKWLEKTQEKPFELFEKCVVGDRIRFNDGVTGLVIRSTKCIADEYSHQGKAVLLTYDSSGHFWGSIANMYFNHIREGAFSIIGSENYR